MFYVKGAAFLHSFSSPRRPEPVAASATDNNTAAGGASTSASQLPDSENSSQEEPIQFSADIELAFNMFPVFFIAAVSLPLIAALYPFLVIPVLLQSVATTANNNTSHPGNFSVPLGIDCPRLTPRNSPPTSVRDLRPDDIRIVMGLGDR